MWSEKESQCQEKATTPTSSPNSASAKLWHWVRDRCRDHVWWAELEGKRPGEAELFLGRVWVGSEAYEMAPYPWNPPLRRLLPSRKPSTTFLHHVKSKIHWDYYINMSYYQISMHFTVQIVKLATSAEIKVLISWILDILFSFQYGWCIFLFRLMCNYLVDWDSDQFWFFKSLCMSSQHLIRKTKIKNWKKAVIVWNGNHAKRNEHDIFCMIGFLVL